MPLYPLLLGHTLATACVIVYTHVLAQLICRMSAKHPSRLVVHGHVLVCYCMLVLYVYVRLALYLLLICYVRLALYVLLICYVRLALCVYLTHLYSAMSASYLPPHRVRCTVKCAAVHMFAR
jgi:hypothetical protein